MLGERSKATDFAEQALTISRAISSRRLEVSVLTRLGIMHVEANQLEAAEEAFRSAQQIEDEFKESIPMFEIQAGLAEVALANGEAGKARMLIQELAREILQEPPSEQSHILPLWLYVACIRVMKASGDAETQKMTRRANDELKMRAEKISDAALRAGYMDAPESRVIAASFGGEAGLHQ
jgi:ATP/maltotriose-dependent transcriptional regulator MalT